MRSRFEIFKIFFIDIFFIIILIIISLASFNAYSNYNKKIVLFGDSLMSGYGLDKQFHLANILKRKIDVIDKKYNYTIENASVAGDTSAGGLNRIRWSLKDNDVHIIILGLGANDMLRGLSPSNTYNNLKNIIKILKKKNIEIILAGMIAPTNYGYEYKNSFDQIYYKLAKEFNLKLIPFLLKDIALKPSLNLSDGMHPNAKGVEIMANNILEYLF